VTIVICCYTEARWEQLQISVASALRQRAQATEVIVAVDNNPALFHRVSSELTGIKAVENRGARGTSGARNAALPFASGEIIAFLDDDAAAEPDWVEQLIRPYADERVLGVGGYIEPNWSSPPHGWFPEEYFWVVGCSYRGIPRRPHALRNMIGANMSFRRMVFDKLGGFRVDLGHDGRRAIGNDETEFCIRIHQYWPEAILLHEPRARVRHHVPDARTRWAYFRKRCFDEGIAKARVARLVGTGDATSSERAYTFRTLPTGVANSLYDAIHNGNARGLLRAGAILAGVGLASAGYAFGTVSDLTTARVLAPGDGPE